MSDPKSMDTNEEGAAVPVGKSNEFTPRSMSDEPTSENEGILAQSTDGTGIERNHQRADVQEEGIKSKQPKGNLGGEDRQPPKDEIRNLEEFIAYAYSRKGQRIVLKPKVEKAICRQSRLAREVRDQLLTLSREDELLAVPRQLLLSIGEVTGYPALREELLSFIGEVLQQHCFFASEEFKAMLNGSLGMSRLIDFVMKVNPEKLAAMTSLKPKRAEELRLNAAYCLATWLAEKRGISPKELSLSLYSSIWYPKAARVKNQLDQLRLVTEIRDVAGVGLACQAFSEKANEKSRAAEIANISESKAIEEANSCHILIDELKNELKKRDETILELQADLKAQNNMHEAKIVHLQDDYENLRSRVLGRLRADSNLLAEGLHALRREQPKLHVMDDHADRVLEGLRREISQLESEG